MPGLARVLQSTIRTVALPGARRQVPAPLCTVGVARAFASEHEPTDMWGSWGSWRPKASNQDIARELEKRLGLSNVTYKANLPKRALFHQAIQNDRGRVYRNGADGDQKARATSRGANGPLIFYTDPTCTGRPTKDTFAVSWPEVDGKIWWKDDLKKFEPEKFMSLLGRVVEHLNKKEATLFVKDVYCGMDPSYAIPYRFVGEYATHAYFVENMFPRFVPGVENEDGKRWITLNAPSFHCDPERDGTPSKRIVALDFRHRIILVAGRADYCGINKKGMFTVMNYLLPEMGHMSMHCSSNVGAHGDTALLFGLSGTGKTTLSADPDRQLIGDDEHAWTQDGISNLEAGCYAKLINLNKRAEPVIAAALSMRGVLVENVAALPNKPIEETDPQDLDLDDNSITENTRISYPLHANPDVLDGEVGPHPNTIVLLTADAFGVLPPISVLSSKEVMYHFVSGFTSKLAGTEVGIIEPVPSFSACFGAAFMPQRVNVYASLLNKKMSEHDTRCVLLNTGWAGGAYGEGKRISIRDTRALLNAALKGVFHEPGTELVTHPVLNLRYPKRCPGVEADILDPRETWEDKAAYDAAAVKLRDMFRKNFADKGFAELGIESCM